MRRLLLLLILVPGGVLLAGASPATAGVGRSGAIGDQIVLSGRVTIEEGESVGNVVVFHGPVTILGDVREAVVVFDGRVRISGAVGEDVVVFNGDVTLEDGARVGGDLWSLREPEIASGATVQGDVGRIRNIHVAYPLAARFAIWLAFSISTLVLGLILLGLAGRGMEAAAAAGRSRMGAAAGWGILLLVGLPIAAVLLLVTLVGIPLGIAVMLGLYLVYVVGYTVGAYALGRVLVKPPRRRAPAFFAGWGILRAVALVPFLGGLAWTLATIGGLGAIIVAVWRARRAAASLPPPEVTVAEPPPAPPAVSESP